MRVAFSGAHRTGKTTLLEAVSRRLSGYEVVDEPYRALEDEGYELSHPPGVEDFERQLRRSLESLASAGAKALFDRCPLDLVAYLQAIDEDYEPGEVLEAARAGMESLDLVVVVAIERPDRIAVAVDDDVRLRRDVDRRVRDLVLDDPHGFGTPAVEVFGGLEERVGQVLRAMRAP